MNIVHYHSLTLSLSGPISSVASSRSVAARYRLFWPHCVSGGLPLWHYSHRSQNLRWSRAAPVEPSLSISFVHCSWEWWNGKSCACLTWFVAVYIRVLWFVFVHLFLIVWGIKLLMFKVWDILFINICLFLWFTCHHTHIISFSFHTSLLDLCGCAQHCCSSLYFPSAWGNHYWNELQQQSARPASHLIGWQDCQGVGYQWSQSRGQTKVGFVVLILCVVDGMCVIVVVVVGLFCSFSVCISVAI